MYRTPGIYREEIVTAPEPKLQTGIPAFLGLTDDRTPVSVNEPVRLVRGAEFEVQFGRSLENGYLADAVRGFFANSSRPCYAVRLRDLSRESLEAGLDSLEAIADLDLVGVPDLAIALVSSLDRVQNAIDNTDPDFQIQRLTQEALALEREVVRWQQLILDRCGTSGDRFAILDSLPRPRLLAALFEATDADSFSSQELRQRLQNADPLQPLLAQRRQLRGANGAVYGAWLDVGKRGNGGQTMWVPPCGHLAGVYARSDDRFGVHKAPANEEIEGAVDVEVDFTVRQSDRLNSENVNALRSLPGRGIRIWGARTLSRDANWTYVNVRRLFLTVGRWAERNLATMVFEPHDGRLWNRVRRELSGYLNGLFQQGALKGSSAQEAFFVRCDARTNPPEVRDAGNLVVEVGLAPLRPSEFIIVRLVRSESGLDF
ncbi:phage tail sheath subtilisin-like domain-containing protein [Geitlerinema sp. CS-897]|nr:phage tail sheath subtilisin-like domain-containing protein [Geitlerinema sp. CS-897]